nr:hypothetical protein [Tanacetum cinerariifolium]
MVRYACGLEAVIRTSWTNRNFDHRFYGCPTLSLTCVNILWWFDPPMCQRSVQIIPGLLRSCNELKEILAMVEEKQHKLLKFLIISWVMGYGIVNECGFDLIDGMNSLCFSHIVMDTLREVQLATEINNLTRQLLGSIDEKRSFIQELEQRLLTNVMAYKTREELKGLQKDDMIKAMEMRTIALQLHLQAIKGFDFYKSFIDEKRSFIQELEKRLLTNVMAYKTREELKGLQKDDMIKAMEMRTIALQLHLQAIKGFDFYKSL